MKNALERLVAVEMLVAVIVLAVVGLCGVARAEPAPVDARKVHAPSVLSSTSTIQLPCPRLSL